MDFELLFNVVLKLAALVAAVAVAYVLPVVASKLKESIGAEKLAQLTEMIEAFVVSAEATLKLSGEEKKAYVEKQLEELGIQVTELVKALIEKAVFDKINNGEVKTKVVDNTPAETEPETEEAE